MSAGQSISVTGASMYASVSTQSGQSLQPFANLNLTEAQRTSLRAILANAKKNGESNTQITKQIDAVLTTAPQHTLASDIKAGPLASPSSTSAASDASRGDSSALDSSSTSADRATPAVTNIQNQATAAKSARINALLAQVLSTNTPTLQ